MGHQPANRPGLPAPSVFDNDIKMITLSLVSNILLLVLIVAERRAPMPSSFTTNDMHSVNNILTDAITLLVLLLTKRLHKNNIHSYKVSMLEDALCLFLATSRIGLGLHMACENLAAIGFQQSRGTHEIRCAWISTVAFCVKVWVYGKTLKVAKTSESALLTLTVTWYSVDGVISLITVASSFGKDIAWVSVGGELAKSLLLLQSGIAGVVLACSSLHDHISKLRLASECKTLRSRR